MWTPKLAPKPLRAVATAVVLCVGLQVPAAAQDLGQEWQAVASEDAAIVFAVPELDDKIERHMRSADPSHRYEVEIALWTGLGAHHPAALVQYFNIYTGYSLRVDVDPKGFIDDLPMFEDKKITFEGRHSAGNKLGPIKSRRFVFEDVECVAFSQTFGHSEYGVGTKRVLGYYCADPGDPLSKTMLSSILNSVDIK